MARRLSAVCLDAGHTLVYCDPTPAELYAAELSRLGRAVDADQVAPVFAAVWGELQRETPTGADRYRRGAGGEREWWGEFVRRVVAALDHDAPWPRLLDQLWQRFAEPSVWRSYPEVPATLTALRSAGLKLAVVSNWDSRLPRILADLGLAVWFDTISVSHLMGVEKPHRAIFERTLERLQTLACDALHAGDSPFEDYRGARAAGIEAVLVDREGLFRSDPYRRIERLDELLELVS